MFALGAFPVTLPRVLPAHDSLRPGLSYYEHSLLRPMADGFSKDGESSLKMASKFGNKGGLFIPAGREVRNSAHVGPWQRYSGSAVVAHDCQHLRRPALSVPRLSNVVFRGLV